MSVVSVVVRLADLVAQWGAPLPSWEQELHQQLVEMPGQLASRSLGEWDERFREAWHSGTQDGEPLPDSVAYMLGRIADLGSFNLYGAFDAPGTRAEYISVLADLSRCLGVQLPLADDLTGW